MKHIAIEKGLTPVSNYLAAYGYEVYEIDAGQKDNKDFIEGFDAVVLTGMNNNFLGFQNTQGSPPVIDASGLSPEDIKKMIERKAKYQ